MIRKKTTTYIKEQGLQLAKNEFEGKGFASGSSEEACAEKHKQLYF